jgi:hypothetical protein
MRPSESGLGAASPVRVKHSSEGLEESESAEGRGGVGLRYDSELADGKYHEGSCWDETELFVGIAQLAVCSGTW